APEDQSVARVALGAAQQVLGPIDLGIGEELRAGHAVAVDQRRPPHRADDIAIAPERGPELIDLLGGPIPKRVGVLDADLPVARDLGAELGHVRSGDLRGARPPERCGGGVRARQKESRLGRFRHFSSVPKKSDGEGSNWQLWIGRGQRLGLICPASLALDKTKPDISLSPSVNPFSASAGRPDAGTVHPLWAVLLVLCASLCFATLSAQVRHLSDLGMHPFVVTFWRNFFGLFFMLPWLVRNGLGILKTGRIWMFTLRSAISFISMVAGFWSLSLMPFAKAISMSFTAPLFATVLAA